MKLIDKIYNVITSLIGGFMLFLVVLISMFASVTALLSISEENKVFFLRSKKIFGLIILFFGLILPFRGISFIGTLFSISWTIIFYDIFSKFKFIQTIITAIGSLILWCYYFYFGNIIFVQIVGDTLLFILVPVAFAIVDLSRGSESLLGREKSNSLDIKINLRSIISKFYSIIDKIFPAD